MKNTDPLILKCQLFCQCTGAVCRSVIHQNNIQIRIGLLPYGVHASWQIFKYIVNRHNHADYYRLIHLKILSNS